MDLLQLKEATSTPRRSARCWSPTSSVFVLLSAAAAPVGPLDNRVTVTIFRARCWRHHARALTSSPSDTAPACPSNNLRDCHRFSSTVQNTSDFNTRVQTRTDPTRQTVRRNQCHPEFCFGFCVAVSRGLTSLSKAAGWKTMLRSMFLLHCFSVLSFWKNYCIKRSTWMHPLDRVL